MENLRIRNQKIINAIVEKANKICPESLALIGITGSFATGDFYEKDNLTELVCETVRVFQSVKKKFTSPKKFRQMSSEERMRRCSRTGAIRCIMRPKGRTDTLRL